MDKVRAGIAMLVLTAAPLSAAAQSILPVTIAGRSFQLPFTTETLQTADGNPGLRVKVDLSPLLAERRTILQSTLALGDDCGLSDMDATLLPVIAEHRRITFRAQDGEVSGEIGRFFKGKISKRIEEAVEKGAPTFDAEALVPSTLRSIAPVIEVQDVRLSGSGLSWRIEAALTLRQPSSPP